MEQSTWEINVCITLTKSIVEIIKGHRNKEIVVSGLLTPREVRERH